MFFRKVKFMASQNIDRDKTVLKICDDDTTGRFVCQKNRLSWFCLILRFLIQFDISNIQSHFVKSSLHGTSALEQDLWMSILGIPIKLEGTIIVDICQASGQVLSHKFAANPVIQFLLVNNVHFWMQLQSVFFRDLIQLIAHFLGIDRIECISAVQIGWRISNLV